MDDSELEKWCCKLESNKVKLRKEAYVELSELLRQKSTLDFMNLSQNDWWGRFSAAIFGCMSDEHEKIALDQRTKGKEHLGSPPSADLFALFVRAAVKGGSSLEYLPVLRFMVEWLNDPVKRAFHPQFLKILSTSLLADTRTRSSLEARDWVSLFSTLKKLCEDRMDNDRVNCLALVVKLGPLHTFPILVFRGQFEYMTELCKMVTPNSPSPQQGALSDILYNFCKYTARDNRMACCKLGEDVFHTLLDLYQRNANEDRIKSNLLNFFLLQVAIHNPKGVPKDHKATYAASWDCWRSCLCSTYDLMCNEIDANLGMTARNRALFVNDQSQLCEGFVRLFVEVSRQLFTAETRTEDEPPRKRQRTEYSMKVLIKKIAETKSWPWITLTFSLIETYPDMVTSDDYVILLQNLASLQSENKEIHLSRHILKALVIFLKIENSVGVPRSRVHDLWRSVSEATLRLIDQNDEDIQTVVRFLILNKHLTCHGQLLQCFRPGGALTLDEHNLKTVDVAFKTFAVLQLDKDLKKQVIKWILGAVSEHFCHGQVANVLVCLVMKRWPNRHFIMRKTRKPFEDIENAYFNVCFESLIVDFPCETEKECSVYSVDRDLLEFLSGAMQTLVNGIDVKKSFDDYVNVCVLVFNVVNLEIKRELVKNGVTSELYRLFERNMKIFFDNVSFKITDVDEQSVLNLTKIARILVVFFKAKGSESVATKLREFVSEQLIRDMFGILNIKDSVVNLLTLKKCLVEVIVAFSCLPTVKSDIQERALKALVSFNYNCRNDDDYKLIITLMRSLRSCKPQTLSVKCLSSLFDFLQKFCEVRYYCNVSVAELLDLFYDIYPLVVASNSEECRSNYVRILYPFYVKRMSYEPSVSVKLLKCMGLLIELDPLGLYTKWSDEDIVLKIPEFLRSDYQEVRFCAVTILASVFRMSSKSRLLEHYNREEMIFSKISDMSVKVLEVENISENRIIDEAIARSSSILHTFVSIMIASNLWIEEALFTLFRTLCDKNLGVSLPDVALEVAAKKLGFKSRLQFLEKYQVGLVTRWQPHNFDKFPFHLYNCTSKIDLFSKYWPSLAHVFIANPENSLNQVASSLGKSVQKLIEDTSPKLLSYCIGQEVSDLSAITTNKIYQLLRDSLGANFKQVFINKIEDVLLYLTDLVSDEESFESAFGISIIFPMVADVRLSVPEFHESLQFIEVSLFDEKSVIEVLIHDNPEKIHFILLQLNLRVHEVQAVEDKLRNFHLYSLIASLCIENVASEDSMQPYLIRDLTHTLLHHIKNNKAQPELSEASCKFFKRLLSTILPSLSSVLSHHFLTIVSRLKSVALENCHVSALCVDVLELLIVDHKTLFVDEISRLDWIPETPEFSTVYTAHASLKYVRPVTLEDEIVQFLDFAENVESLDECEHNIKHLKRKIIEKKEDLRDISYRLRRSSGLSEDCKGSNLHKLVTFLITLSCSRNKNVRTEAAKCLGEIGPVDLATLILQPEKDVADSRWTPFELMLGVAISLLSKYLVDGDVTVIKIAAAALFQVLATVEGRKIVRSEDDFGFGAINPSYLRPFCNVNLRSAKFKVVLNSDCFLKNVQDDELWTPAAATHGTWVTKLVCNLLECFEENEFFGSFVGVCTKKVEFCEQMLPLVIYTVLSLNNFSFTTIISRQIESFFDQHWKITVQKQEGSNITTNKSSVQTILNLVNFVRLQRTARKKEIKHLQLDYLKIAKAAHYCTAHFTALLYVDLWCQEQIDQSPDDYALSTCSYTKLDLIYEKLDDVTANALQNILREAYKCVGETDALFGCGTSHLLDPASRVDHYKELGRWDLVTQHYGRQISLGRTTLHPLVDSLKSANLYQVALVCSASEPDYECLWRLGQWDHATDHSTSTTYDKCKFLALKALHEREDFDFVEAIDEGRTCVLESFKAANMESTKNFYGTFAKLLCLKEIEQFASAANCENIADLLAAWKVQDDLVCDSYRYVEPLQAQRILLFTDYLKRHPTTVSKDAIVDTVLGYAQRARVEGNSQVGFRILDNLRLLPLTDSVECKVKLEEAQLYWSIQDVDTAKCILRHLCISENIDPRMQALALKLRGTWMVESSSESRQTIIEDYFHKSLNLMKRDLQTEEDEKSLIDTFEQLAKFADREYQEVMSHIKSDVFQKKKENIITTKNLVGSIDMDRTTKDTKKAVMIKKKLLCIDEIEIQNIETDKNNLLQLALKYYLRILIRSDNHNMTIFRLFSLLLENRDNALVKPFLEKQLLTIPTYKFINILPQIIPHISNVSNDIFGESINNLIEKCARDHPYHTLPLILALALSNKDRVYSSESKASDNDARTQTAKTILEKLKQVPKLSKLIVKMAFLSEALIELAYHQSTNARSSEKVPKNAKIRKIDGWDQVLLPTHVLPVDSSTHYGNVIGIHKFDDVFYKVGGINAPKRIACVGTDGVTRSQLIKGQDDLRQDAVMQQVFTIMNSLFAVNKQTKDFRIRTYKIVPLSMRSGVLEWVENTTPIGTYLTGEGSGEEGAHVKFRPTDKSPHSCRVEFKNASSKSNEGRLRAFNKICSSIKPVFHKFFETNFPQPTVWYERRRTYTRSVAASSMCGYILGIGDRHLNNVLIDTNTAEVVHIDFGIAFEQGRVLPTPETVPFRLTRDIVDGMGVSGVEGVFRRSCEKTAEVLRLHHQTIITTLEVLLYDPLYDWTVSTAEANKRQKGEQDDEFNGSQSSVGEERSRNVNETAERALLRLRAKLQGTENGKSTTVEHQVGILIQQAVDPSNLSKMFYGWQPYL